jgi:radical SAM protein with 4Fe4S-binding SPASM domain
MDVHHYAKDRGKSVHYSSARPHLTTNTFCTATSNALIVTTDGELTACYEVFDHSHILAEDFIIGRIDLTQGVVLYPDKRENLQKKISDNRHACEDCFCYYHCAGDCPPKAFLSHLSNDKFRCSVTRAITRELILDKIEENNGFWHGDHVLSNSHCNTKKQIIVKDT